MRLALCLSIALAARTARAEEVTIHEDVTLYKRASRGSTALLSLEAGESADVIRQREDWIEVRVHGRKGWIPEESTIELIPDEPEETAEAEPEAEVVAEPEPEPVEEAAPEQRTVEVQLAVGLAVIEQGFRTSTVGDNYNIGVTAAALALSGGYTHRLRDDLVIGGELAYSYQKALPGIRNTDPESGDAITTAFAVHDAGLSAVVGYDLQRASGLMILARAGVRYHSFQIADVRDPAANPSRIPSEIQISPTIGAGIWIPRVTSKLGLRFVLDTYLAGTHVEQTSGQEDGVDPKTRGARLQSALAYRWRHGLDVQLTHQVDVAMLELGAPDPNSARMHAGDSVARFDIVHVLTVGVVKGF
jgi:opacity protein-like surface antigen